MGESPKEVSRFDYDGFGYDGTGTTGYLEKDRWYPINFCLGKFTLYEWNRVDGDNGKKSLKFLFFKDDPRSDNWQGGGETVEGNEVKIDSEDNKYQIDADVYGRVVATRTKLYVMNSF